MKVLSSWRSENIGETQPGPSRQREEAPLPPSTQMEKEAKPPEVVNVLSSWGSENISESQESRSHQAVALDVMNVQGQLQRGVAKVEPRVVAVGSSTSQVVARHLVNHPSKHALQYTIKITRACVQNNKSNITKITPLAPHQNIPTIPHRHLTITLTKPHPPKSSHDISQTSLKTCTSIHYQIHARMRPKH